MFFTRDQASCKFAPFFYTNLGSFKGFLTIPDNAASGSFALWCLTTSSSASPEAGSFVLGACGGNAARRHQRAALEMEIYLPTTDGVVDGRSTIPGCITTDVTSGIVTGFAIGSGVTCADDSVVVQLLSVCDVGTILNAEETNCIDVNECALDIDNCDAAHATCTDTVGSFTCICEEGYTTTTQGTICVDVTECADGATNTCDSVHGTCIEEPGTFSCACDAGWEPRVASVDFNTGQSILDFSICVNVNECGSAESNVCDTEATCTDTQGSYTCTCDVGWTGAGEVCTVIIMMSDCVKRFLVQVSSNYMI